MNFHSLCARSSTTAQRSLGVALLATAEGGRWHPGIGDPTPMGWLTVVAYFAAAWACFMATQRARRMPDGSRRLVFAWGALCLGMVLLGINKQLDLQTLFTELLRDNALETGWYEDRRVLQVAFIRAIAGVGFGGAALVIFWLRREARHLWLAALGGVFIVAFVIVRAASFHDVDTFLRQGPGGLRMNWVLELGGIGCVWLAARRFGRQHSGGPGA